MSDTIKATFCIKCGSKVGVADSFCPYCGADIPSKIYCSMCGSVNSKEQSFCENCGSDLAIDNFEIEKRVPSEQTLFDKQQGSKQEADLSSFENFELTYGQQENKKPTSEKRKSIQIAVATSIICFLIAGIAWFFFSNGDISNSPEDKQKSYAQENSTYEFALDQELVKMQQTQKPTEIHINVEREENASDSLPITSNAQDSPFFECLHTSTTKVCGEWEWKSIGAEDCCEEGKRKDEYICTECGEIVKTEIEETTISAHLFNGRTCIVCDYYSGQYILDNIQPISDGMTTSINKNLGDATWSIFVQEVAGGTAFYSENTQALSASAMVIVPVLYTVASEVDEGNLTLSDSVTITMQTSGRTQLAGSIGKSLTIKELCTYMLQYSDNIATNTLMQYLGFDRITEVCKSSGYESVSLVNYLMHTEDNTTNDNYISTADLCGMLSELYSDTFESLGKQFLQDNMVIQDNYAREGLITSIPNYITVMNLNGQKTNKYNEVAIVDNGSSAYVIAFMSNDGNLTSLKQAALVAGANLVAVLQLEE